MKATGIVRRIDDLGRVVIPKEIRRTMRIHEGDPLEIFTNKDGEVIFKKYSAAITDKDSVIAVSGTGKKEISEKKISSDIEEILKDRTSLLSASKRSGAVKLTQETDKFHCYIVVPIISEGDVIGSVILYGVEENAELTETEDKLAITAATVLGKIFL